MKRRGKFILTVVILVLLSGMLCGFTQDTLPQEQQLFLDHLEGYLAFSEETLAQMCEALDRAEEFTKDNSWDSLLKARAACYSAKSYLQRLELPEYTLTDSQYEALLDAGIEADVILMAYRGFEDTRAARIDSINSLTSILEQDVFLSASMSAFPQWVESQKSMIAAESEYLCIMANYLLVQLDVQELWEKMPEAYPCISEQMQAWDSDLLSLVEKSTAALDRYEEQFEKLIEYTATSKYTLSIVQEAVDTGDYTRLSEQIHTVAGVPGYIPMPHWVPEDVQSIYCVKDSDTGKNRPVKAGEAITQTPSACYIFCGKISRKNVDAYIQAASELEYSVSEKEEDGEYSAFITNGEWELLIEWTPSETGLYLREPIACLIPELYFAAMRQK